jgi:hypothetical protein
MRAGVVFGFVSVTVTDLLSASVPDSTLLPSTVVGAVYQGPGHAKRA